MNQEPSSINPQGEGIILDNEIGASVDKRATTPDLQIA